MENVLTKTNIIRNSKRSHGDKRELKKLKCSKFGAFERSLNEFHETNRDDTEQQNHRVILEGYGRS